ncbi:MAG: acyltransferase 3 [Candidatus Saccharibacteria bacterium]|nr:acyltransferase 3 [Candidatus Saccharibacteria bacterium]
MNKQRFYELEGLRGVAAIAVVLYHYSLAFYAMIFYGSIQNVVQNMQYEDNLYGNPISVFFSGTFAVAIFFVLSGFVLSIAFFQTGKLDIIKKLATKRYLRLMLPALASVMICYVVFKLGIFHIREAAAMSNSWWLKTTWTFTPHLTDAISDGVYGIFTQGSDLYNNVLWTMQTEFLGSFIVFGFAALFYKVKYRWVLYVALMVVLFNTWLLGFIIGMALADAYANGRVKSISNPFAAVVVVVGGLFLGGYPLNIVTGTVYQVFAVPGLAVKWNMFYLTIGASLLVFGVLSVTRLAKFFQNKRVSILGRYTFSLYLVHLVILYSFTTFVFVELRTKLGFGYNLAAVTAIVSSAPVIFGVTILFERYIDAPSIRLSTYFANVVLGNTELDLNRRLQSVARRVVRAIPTRRFSVPQEELLAQEELES